MADLLVEDLTAGSAALRGQIPGLLAQLVDDGVLMAVDGAYRLQTQESREWTQDFQHAATAASRPTTRASRLIGPLRSAAPCRRH